MHRKCCITYFVHFVISFTACPRSIYGGVLWKKTAENTLANKPCTDAGVYFRTGPTVSRYCQNGGTWANVDFTSCTLTTLSTPFALVWLVVEANSVEDVQNDQTLLEHEVTKCSCILASTCMQPSLCVCVCVCVCVFVCAYVLMCMCFRSRSCWTNRMSLTVELYFSLSMSPA